MKLTAKIYQAEAELKRNIYNLLQNSETTAAEHLELTKKYDDLVKWFESLPTVSVSYMIGYRSYYSNAVQIGAAFFDGSVKMTKSNGYRSIEVIPAITDKMKAAMLDDMYYY